MNADERKVIVIGGSHHNTLGVIRSLGMKGLCQEIQLYLKPAPVAIWL